MDEKKAFEIRRKVLESGVDFEEYISKQQAEIDAMSAGLVKARNAFIEGDMDEVYHQIYTLMVAHDVHNPRACKNFIAKHRGK